MGSITTNEIKLYQQMYLFSRLYLDKNIQFFLARGYQKDEENDNLEEMLPNFPFMYICISLWTSVELFSTILISRS